MTMLAVAAVVLNHGPMAQVVVATLPLAASYWVFSAGVSLMQGMNEAATRAAAIATNGLLTFAATALALQADATLESAVAASAFAYLALGVGLWRRATSKARSSAAAAALSSATVLRESRPLFGSNALTFALSSGDVLAASLLMPSAAVGQYQIAKKVAQSAVLPLIATLPMAMGKLAGRPPKAREELTVKLAMAAACVFSAGAVAGAFALPQLLGRVFGPAFAGLTGVTLTLLTAFSLQYFRDLMSVSLTASGRFKIPLASSAVSLAAFVVGAGSVAAVAGTLELFSVVLIATFGAGLAIQAMILRQRGAWAPSTLMTFVAISTGCTTFVASVAWLSL